MLEHPDQEIKESGTTGARRAPDTQDSKSKQINLIHRNKHQETTKMKRQKSNPQMKEKEKSPKKELSEIEASNLSDVEFKVMVIKMLKELSEKYRNLVGPTAA